MKNRLLASPDHEVMIDRGIVEKKTMTDRHNIPKAANPIRLKRRKPAHLRS
jgi:hypothetical protein